MELAAIKREVSLLECISIACSRWVSQSKNKIHLWLTILRSKLWSFE